jgi:hypothetical protein
MQPLMETLAKNVGTAIPRLEKTLAAAGRVAPPRGQLPEDVGGDGVDLVANPDRACCMRNRKKRL